MILHEDQKYDIVDLQKLADNLNADLEELSNSPTIPKTYSNPYLQIFASGVGSQSGLDFIFSGASEKALMAIFDTIGSGNFDRLSKDIIPKIQKLFSVNDVGTGMFKGEIGTKVINNIRDSFDSHRFKTAKSKLKRVMIVLGNLKKQGKTIKDPEMKKKYNDAVYAVYQGLKIINKIYKNRKMINDRLLVGVKNIVNESEEYPIILHKI